jgi:hypothetical protein
MHKAKIIYPIIIKEEITKNKIFVDLIPDEESLGLIEFELFQDTDEGWDAEGRRVEFYQEERITKAKIIDSEPAQEVLIFIFKSYAEQHGLSLNKETFKEHDNNYVAIYNEVMRNIERTRPFYVKAVQRLFGLSCGLILFLLLLILLPLIIVFYFIRFIIPF